MILTRMGNKKSLIKDIWKYFPPHKLRIDLFFGAGGAFFNMPKAKYNILNDLDDDVVNLYLVVQNDRDRLYKAIEKMPIATSLVRYYSKNTETDPIKKALRFLLLSNFTYLGKGDTMRLGLDNSKSNILEKIEFTFESLKDVQISNSDFRDVLKKVSFSETVLPKKDAFVYLDPVYLETTYTYKVQKWTAEDTIDCFDIMSNSGIKCAMSEFDHPLIVSEANKRNFQIIPVANRQNIKNRRTELLITNYRPQNLLF